MYLPVRIAAVLRPTRDTAIFQLSAASPIAYQPGQFISLVRAAGAREIRRQYSFVSHPRLHPEPSILVKRVPNGEMSRWLLDHINTGDQIDTAGVAGQFVLPPAPAVDTVILLAAGSGITPVYSLLLDILHFRPHLRAVLVYSNRDTADILFKSELDQLQRQFAHRLIIEYFVSNHANLRRARLGKVLLEELLQMYAPRPEQVLGYVCGPLDYRQMVHLTLRSHGLDEGHIFREVFYSPEPLQRPEPPDRDAHLVTLVWEGTTYRFETQYPDSILHTARQHGIRLPYSCEAGRCGACAATCQQGQVWMQRNEVLLDREVESGRVLTCTGYPVGGDVALRI